MEIGGTAGAASAVSSAADPPYRPTPENLKAREWFQDAKFGLFIHWGPVSLKGTEIGWSRGAPTPIEEYDNLYLKFNPVKFNADENPMTPGKFGVRGGGSSAMIAPASASSGTVNVAHACPVGTAVAKATVPSGCTQK